VQRCLKRCFDIAVAGIGLLVLAPLFGVVAAAIWLTMGSPIFFKQRRPGLHERLFTVCKFRTMMDARDEKGELLLDSERITPLGRLIRDISIDELPQLWNVLRGHMSLVGPRPLLSLYLDRYNAFQHRRHEVKPGITGWAQVNGRNAINWETKFELDVWYVDHWNLLLDLKILLKTVRKVFRREGIAQIGPPSEFQFRGAKTSSSD